MSPRLDRFYRVYFFSSPWQSDSEFNLVANIDARKKRSATYFLSFFYFTRFYMNNGELFFIHSLINCNNCGAIWKIMKNDNVKNNVPIVFQIANVLEWLFWTFFFVYFFSFFSIFVLQFILQNCLGCSNYFVTKLFYSNLVK